jgi:hypothetical protein
MDVVVPIPDKFGKFKNICPVSWQSRTADDDRGGKG